MSVFAWGVVAVSGGVVAAIIAYLLDERRSQ
jgi:hypothetical protein